MQVVGTRKGDFARVVRAMSHVTRFGTGKTKTGSVTTIVGRGILPEGMVGNLRMHRGRGFAVACAFACGAWAWAESGATVGALPLTALNGDEVTIEPHSVLGALLIVGFSQESSEQTRAWGKHVADWADEHAGDAPPPPMHLPMESSATEDPMPVFSIVVIGEASRFMRGMFRRMMKGVMPEEVEGSFFLAYERADAWREVAEVGDEAAAYVFRIDPQGRICERHAGPPSDEALAGLLNAPCSF